jgi:hypothetical protein
VTYTAYDINNLTIDQFSTRSVLSPRPQATDLRVSPTLPKAQVPFNVTATVTNSTSLASVKCQYRERPASTYTGVTMMPVGGTPHRYLATLGPLAVVQPFFRFYIEVNDTAGANYRSLLGQFTVDSVPPNVTVQQPTNGSAVAGWVAVRPLVQDDVGVTHVEFYVDGLLQTNMSLYATYVVVPWDWNTYDYSNGIHTIRIVVYDVVGRSASAVVNVTVNNVPYPLIPPVWIAVGGGVLLAGVVVVLAVIVLRRRRFGHGKESHAE